MNALMVVMVVLVRKGGSIYTLCQTNWHFYCLKWMQIVNMWRTICQANTSLFNGPNICLHPVLFTLVWGFEYYYKLLKNRRPLYIFESVVRSVLVCSMCNVYRFMSCVRACVCLMFYVWIELSEYNKFQCAEL